jgi:FlaG/FlaF family flagellin (archaellin)
VSRRATSSVVGIALVALLTVLSAGVVGAATFGIAATEQAPARASFALAADADADRITLTHRGGDAIDVERVRLVVTVDGRRLAHQPPVPFFAADGFESGPTGPFNSRHEGPWRAGQRAGLRLASTNAPTLTEGASVRVAVYQGDYPLATLTTQA